jgi:hypothetical protein
MSIIPLPERGQPLDVTYIYQLANAVNQLSSNNGASSDKYVSIDIPSGGVEHKNVSNVRMFASYVSVVNSASKTAGEEVTFPIKFAFEFKYPPIITATPVNVRNTVAGKNVTVVLNDITTSSAQGVVRFNSSGDLSVGVNLIIIGVPNQ